VKCQTLGLEFVDFLPAILWGLVMNFRLHQFVNELRIPFVTTQMGKGVISDDHPLCLGCAALSSNDFVHVCIEKADLIVNIGHDVVEKPPFIMQFVSVTFHLLEVSHASNFATFVPGSTGVFCWWIYFV
jgi:thiamine pyrophosphate-dependent acetolactate synthase large subunit-like protein